MDYICIMGHALKKDKVTATEYLTYLDTIDGKAEFYDGVIYDMAGSSIQHVRIATNIIVGLSIRLEGSPCEVFGTDLKTEVEFLKAYSIPDTTVVCGEPETSQLREDIVKNPVLIVEVLSPNSERFDRGIKFDRYKRIPTFREYLLVHQEMARVEDFFRNHNGAREYQSYSEMDDVVELRSLGITLTMKEIYKRVAFEEAE